MTILAFDKARLLPIIFILLSMPSKTSETEISYAFITDTSPDVASSIDNPGEIKANCELSFAIWVACSAVLKPRFVTLFIYNKKG